MRRLAASIFALAVPLSPPSQAEPARDDEPPAALSRCDDLTYAAFRIPGSDMCVRIGARVRMDALYDQRFRRGDDAAGSLVRATFGFEGRSPTDWGPLALTLRFTAEHEPRRHGGASSPELEYAALDWQGVTIGRATSFFDRAYPTGGVTLMGGGANGRGSDRGAVNLLGYRLPIAGTWAATASLEDPTARRVGVVGAYQAGARWPDLVLTASGESRWGRHHFALAFHETRPAPAGYRSQLGFAVQSSAEFPAPALPDTVLRMQSAAAYGASDYTGWGYVGVGLQTPRTADLWLGPRGPRLSWTNASSVSVIHRWSPALRLALFSAQGLQFTWPYGVLAHVTTIGGNVVWSPVHGMEVGLEAAFARVRIAPLDPAYPASPGRRHGWSGRFRLQQDF